MKLSEIVEILKNPDIQDNRNYILNKINHEIHTRFGMNNITFPKRRLEEYFSKIDAKGKPFSNYYYLRNPEITIPPEEDIDIECEYIFYKGLPKENLKRVAAPPTREWNVKKEDIKKEDIYDIILRYHNLRKEANLPNHPEFRPLFLHRVALYITKILEHPLDALYVDNETAGEALNQAYIPRGTNHNMNTYIVKLIGLCLALKYKVKIDFAFALEIFKYFGHRSMMKITSTEKSMEELETFRDLMSSEAKLMLSLVKDGDVFLAQIDEAFLLRGKLQSFPRGGSDVFYYLFAILLEHGTRAWNEVPIITAEKLRRYYLVIPVNSGLKKQSIDYLFMNKVPMTSPFHFIGRKNVKDTFFPFNPEIKDEIADLLANFRIYLSKKGVFGHVFTDTGTLINYKPSDMIYLNQLTEENIEKCCINYIEHVEKHDLDRSSARRLMRGFLSVMATMKEVFSQVNILGLEPKTEIPFDERLLKLKNTKYDDGQLTVYGRLANRLKMGGQEIDEDNEAINPTTRNYKGTLKEDIVKADEIVRAIYNYMPKGEESTVEYFYEYQCTTMLRMAADSGCRIEEVMNAPFGTLSYLPEEDVNICILGLSKLGERFGVVPVGKETAEMIQRCAEMRMELFPNSKVYLEMKGKKGKYEAKYIMQFIKYHGKQLKTVSINDLTKHLEKICEEANIPLSHGKKFHFLRHRAAEYFFFAMSYYDFEYKNDSEYKNSIVKRLLRHRRIKMTENYVWGELLNLLSEKKLLFLRDLNHLEEFEPEKLTEHAEKKLLIDSLKKKIEKNLESKISKPGIERIALLLSSPLTFLEENSIMVLNKAQDFSSLLDSLRRVDGEKSEGTVPAGAAYFGRCVNPTCYRVKERITCVSCEDHLIQKRDEKRMIGEMVKCHKRIQEIYKNYNPAKDHKEQLRSLHSRIATCIYRLHFELEVTDNELIEKTEKYIIDAGYEEEVQISKFIKDHANLEYI